MRTKVLLLAAAISAAGIAASLAQSNVYSVNVVGYYNVTLYGTADARAGYTMMANQLDLDGTGQNNTLQSVFGTQLNQSAGVWNIQTVDQTDPTGFKGVSYSSKGGFAGDAASLAKVTKAIQPGGGVWVFNPGASDVTVTVVGNVMQGALSNSYIANLNQVSSMVPQAGTMEGDLKYTPAPGGLNTIQIPNPATPGGFDTYTRGVKGWSPSEPSLAVGQAVYLNSIAGSAWQRNFTVQ